VAVQLATEGKSPEIVLSEFQKLGLMLTHILECPLDDRVSESKSSVLLENQLPATLARVRRSFKPKRLLLISSDLHELADKIRRANLECPVLPSPSGAFLTTLSPSESDLQAFRSALAISNAHAV